MQFASKDLQKRINDCAIKTEEKLIKTPYLHFQNRNKEKYRQCLNLIEEWQQDLLERQNNVHKIQEKYLQASGQQNKENRQINMNTNHPQEFDLEQMLSQQFVKKMESLYMKQFMLRDFDNDSNIKAKSYNTFQEMDSL